MKFRLFSAALLASFFGFSVFADSGLNKLAGTYAAQNGARFIVSVNGHVVTLRTNSDLSQYGLCRAPLTLNASSASEDADFAEADFSVRQDQCSSVDGPIILHYNRAVTGVDVYLVDVVIRRGPPRSGGRTVRWHLTKIR